MRVIGILLLILFCLGWLASEYSLNEGPPPPPSKLQWRRTADGWEQATWLSVSPSVQHTEIHPAVVALSLMFLVIAALLVLTEQEQGPAEVKVQLHGEPPHTDSPAEP